MDIASQSLNPLIATNLLDLVAHMQKKKSLEKFEVDGGRKRNVEEYSYEQKNVSTEQQQEESKKSIFTPCDRNSILVNPNNNDFNNLFTMDSKGVDGGKEFEGFVLPLDIAPKQRWVI